jgi:anti-anti-sigma factor
MNAWSIEPDVLCASLAAEPRVQPELALLRKHLSEREPSHLIVDLSRVEILSSPGIGALLLLRQMQVERGSRLLLCNVALATKCILRVVGLDSVFDYAEDRTEALRALRQSTGSTDEIPSVIGFRDARQESPAGSRPVVLSADPVQPT